MIERQPREHEVTLGIVALLLGLLALVQLGLMLL